MIAALHSMMATLRSVHQKAVEWRNALIMLRVIFACLKAFPKAELIDEARFNSYLKYYSRKSELHLVTYYMAIKGIMLMSEQGILDLPAQDVDAAELIEAKRSGPPSGAEFVAALLDGRDFVLGDRAENFARNVIRFGRRRAVLLYWWDILKSVQASLWSSLKRVAFFAMVVDLYRRARGL